jgi:hypothetical protein
LYPPKFLTNLIIVKIIKLVLQTVPIFLSVYNSTDSASRIKLFQSLYLDIGSVGLNEYASLRFQNAASLVNRIYNSSVFCNKLALSLKQLNLSELYKKIDNSINKFTTIYNYGIIPNIYLLIGGIGNDCAAKIISSNKKLA